jgi:hypothetical protein
MASSNPKAAVLNAKEVVDTHPGGLEKEVLQVQRVSGLVEPFCEIGTPEKPCERK